MTMLGMWTWQQNVCRFGAEGVAARCARVGATDLFFLTKGLSGETAFHGALAPHAYERDLLRELTDAAHRRGIRVHAWFTSACDEHYKCLHPQSGRCHYVRGRDRGLISLADEGYLTYMEQIIHDVSRRYEIDGLHLDYIRYNHLLYGWAEEDLQRYAAQGADSGYLHAQMKRMFQEDPKDENALFHDYRAGDENALALARARRGDVVRFADRLIRAARSEKSGLAVSAALMPEGAYEDIAFSDLHYGQNYEDAAQLFDLVLPMAYSKAYDQNAQWVRRVAEGTLRRGLRTVMGLHAYEGGTGLSLKADLESLQGLPLEGVCLFREGAVALACADGKKLWIANALEERITGVMVNEGRMLDACIEPGKEETFVLPDKAHTVRVFAGEKERCVYLSPKA